MSPNLPFNTKLEQ